ncbi:LytTR family DNA-binding domain-containing protein [uncultured Arcticibacterium sp.]|uniref:LytR/AlgR family response regulator transcription factor n=1 Tax=uncultured Arcticibacterium sp. TaxID=2173042 RepID=UPI0030F5A3F6
MNYFSSKVEKLIGSNLKDVSHFKADINYTCIHLKNGEKHMLSYTLKRFEEMLEDSENFVRIHRRYIVNFDFVSYSNKHEVQLRNGEFLPIARRKRSLSNSH